MDIRISRLLFFVEERRRRDWIAIPREMLAEISIEGTNSPEWNVQEEKSEESSNISRDEDEDDVDGIESSFEVDVVLVWLAFMTSSSGKKMVIFRICSIPPLVKESRASPRTDGEEDEGCGDEGDESIEESIEGGFSDCTPHTTTVLVWVSSRESARNESSTVTRDFFIKNRVEKRNSPESDMLKKEQKE